MKKLIHFLLLILFMQLLNIVWYIIGILCIHNYSQYVKFDFLPSLFLISTYSFLQIYIFPIKKKHREYIIPLCTLLVSLLMLYNDYDYMGGEVMYNLSTTTSKIIDLLVYIGSKIDEFIIRKYYMFILFSIGYSLYLFVVFHVYKHLLYYFENKQLLYPYNKRSR